MKISKAWSLVAAAGLIVVLTGGAASSCGGTTGSSQSAGSNTQAVTYEVTGSGAASLTYTTDGAASTEQIDSAKLPWTKTINVPAGYALVSLMAQNKGSGSITCKITNGDGEVVKQATSSGKYSIASCAGSVS